LNQLAVLDGRGAFDVAIGDVTSYPAIRPSSDTSLGLETRVRTYLAMNCAQCHQPNGPAPGGLDLRFDTLTANSGMLDAVPQSGDLGLTDARIVAPGNKESSVLWERVGRLDSYRMPKIGSHRIDQTALDLIGMWIDSL
jgi:hypothetical protein